MRLPFTNDELVGLFQEKTTKEIVQWLTEVGLELVEPLADPEFGVYRRELGMDLVQFDGCWHGVDRFDDESVTWACFDEVNGDWWVQVLDINHYPVYDEDAFRVKFDYAGKRVG